MFESNSLSFSSRNPHTYGRRRVGEDAAPARTRADGFVDENVPPVPPPIPEPAPIVQPELPAVVEDATEERADLVTENTVTTSEAINSITAPSADPEPPVQQNDMLKPETASVSRKRKASRNGNIMDFFKRQATADKVDDKTQKTVEMQVKVDNGAKEVVTAKKDGIVEKPKPDDEDDEPILALVSIGAPGTKKAETIADRKLDTARLASEIKEDEEGDEQAEDDDADESVHDDKDEDYDFQMPKLRLYRKKSAKGRNASARAGPVLHQSTIDLGQKMQTTCKLCNMSYVPSNHSDQEMHAQFHKSYVSNLTWHEQMSKIWSGTLPKNETVGVVVVVTAHTAANHQKKISEIVEQIEVELGGVKGSWGGFGGATDRKVFLTVVEKKPVGVLVVERIRHAYTALVTADGQIEEDVADGAKDVIMGISRLWTSHCRRRQGIASLMIEIAQLHFIYGTYIERHQVAFSQPTESGGRFARAWWGGSGWLVYDQDKAYNEMEAEAGKLKGHIKK